MSNLNISVILPIESSKHKDFVTLFNSCVTSIKNQVLVDNKENKVVGDIELVLVHSGEESLVSHINDYDFEELDVSIIHNEGETAFVVR